MVSTETCGINLMKKNWLFFFSPLQKYRTQKLEKIALILANVLKSEARQDVLHASQNPKILATRKFLKGITISNPAIEQCREQLLAAKLGIDAEVFHHNPGFKSFAEKSHLERYLIIYDHKLLIDATSKKLSLLVAGNMMLWEEVRKMMADWPSQSKESNRAWQYGMQGVQNKNLFDWTELKPFKRANPMEWGNRFILELCVCCSAQPRLRGDHSWIRLKTPTGDIYSVGLYREDKGGSVRLFQSPLKIKKGSLMQPDVSEFYPDPIYTIPFGISEEQFLNMKAAIERDKFHNNLPFQIFQENCVIYIKKIAGIAGIVLPAATISIYRLMTPKILLPVIDFMSQVLPNCISKICSIVYTVFMNLVQLVFGAALIDKSLKNRPFLIPHIASIADIFKSSKLELHHPNSLVHVIRKQVLNWRESEIAKLVQQRLIPNCNLDLINQKIAEMPYCIPILI